jgi:hypothetical protein
MIVMCVRLANGAACLRIIVQLYAEAAKRDAEKTGGVRTIAVAAYESSENMPALNLGKSESASIWFHDGGYFSI